MNLLKVENKLNNQTAEIYLMGTIGEEVNCSEFANELKTLSLNYRSIVIHINSAGGNVFDGLAMFEAVKNCKCETIAKIDGLCASMATIVALGVRKVLMSNTALFMTHRVKGDISGNSNEIKTYAGMIDNIENVFAEIYSKKTGLSIADAKERFLKDEDTWFTAKEALSQKLIDGIYDAEYTSDHTITNDIRKNKKSLIAYFNQQICATQSQYQGKVFLSDKQLLAIGLNFESSSNEITIAIDALIERASKVDLLQMNLTEIQRQVNCLKKENNIHEAKVLFGSQTWDELDRSGKLERLKEMDLQMFSDKFKEKFGVLYKGASA